MSKLLKLKEKLAAMLLEVKMAVIKTNNGVLEYDGDEELVAGVKVFVSNEETGERVPATDGEYITEDNKVITVKDGVVESIVDTEAEVDGEDKPAENTEEVAAEETPEENKPEDVPNEDGGEEKPVDAIEELRKEVNELYKIIEGILKKIGEDRAEVDAKLSKIEKMSNATPIDEVFENNNTVNTGDAKLDEKLNRVKEMSKNWRTM